MKKLILGLLIIGLTGCYETEKGIKVGNIIKLAQEGGLIKTYEAQLIRGGMSNGTGAFSPHPFNFTIEKSNIIEKAKQAMDKQQEVKITYHREWIVMPWRQEDESDRYFADDIEVITNK